MRVAVNIKWNREATSNAHRHADVLRHLTDAGWRIVAREPSRNPQIYSHRLIVERIARAHS